MSIKIMQEAWDHSQVSQGTLLVLLALADSADERSRECWPSIASIAKKARLSERQVQRCIMELVEHCVLVVFPNAGRSGSNLFRISEVSNWHGDKMSGGDAHVTGGVTPMSPGGVTPMSPKPSLRTINEPSSMSDDDLFSEIETIAPRPTVVAEKRKTEEDFDRFWRVFPAGRKTDKPKAAAIFGQIVAGKHKLISKTDAEAIISGAERYAATNPDPQYVPIPKTWLNGARWEDVPAAPPPTHHGGHRLRQNWGEVLR